jgi:plasmid stability protein
MRMPKHLQIRDVPDPLHRKLKARAALAGKSLSDYLLDEIQEIANRPTMEEILARLAELGPVDPGETSEEAIRAERDAR